MKSEKWWGHTRSHFTSHRADFVSDGLAKLFMLRGVKVNPVMLARYHNLLAIEVGTTISGGEGFKVLW